MGSLEREVDRLLEALSRDEASLEELALLVHGELRRIARSRLRGERRDHTLQATALVHEAWLRLAGDRGLACASASHFFSAAAEAMRRVLVDHARKLRTTRRGGGQPRMSFEVCELAVADDPDRLLALDEALTRLAREDARAAEVARLRLYAGLSPDEAAGVLGVSVRTAGREWTYARARLEELLDGEAAGEGPARR